MVIKATVAPFVASLGPSREITEIIFKGARKEAYKKFCKWIYGHKQSSSNITTRGDYIITQYNDAVCYSLLGLSECGDKNSSYFEQGTSSTDPSKNWTWVQNASDGAHAFAMSNSYYTIDYKGYPDPIIKQSGSTYYIDYGAVDMNGLSGSSLGNHLQVNPDCTELPCPAGTANLGTYYNHTAASVGSSYEKKSTDFPNELAPDSICPKGWMLPTYYETADKPFPTKSYSNLVFTAYGGREVSSGGTNADVIALYPPLSFLRSGYYIYTSTAIYNPGINGRYWGARPNSTGTGASALVFGTTLLQKASYNKASGQSVRCVSRD